MATSNTSEKIILGIDPGTTIMGFGLIKVKGKTMEFLQLNELHVYMSTSYNFLDQLDIYSSSSKTIDALKR